MRESDRATICVGAWVDPGLPFGRETMHALPDPADPHQAVLQNVPFFVDGLNFGDLIRLGEPDHIGIHPIEAVVEASGHTRFLLILEDQPVPEMFEFMEDLFSVHELRLEAGGDGLVAVSVHPDLDPEEFFDPLLDWLSGYVPPEEDLLDLPAFSISEPIHTRLGPLSPTHRGPHRA
jgi:hypothetical protein